MLGLDGAHLPLQLGRIPASACPSARGETPATIPLRTKYGKLFFHLAQNVEAVQLGKAKQYQVRTLAYWYRLQATPSLKDEALLRWEYGRLDPKVADHPRHHLQAPATIACGKNELDLNKLHTPSGWVTIEELLRFLIFELEVKAATPEWPALLAQSEIVFFREFSAKTGR